MLNTTGFFSHTLRSRIRSHSSKRWGAGCGPAIGKTATGSWRTAQLKEYPPRMCRAIAEALLDAFVDRIVIREPSDEDRADIAGLVELAGSVCDAGMQQDFVRSASECLQHAPSDWKSLAGCVGREPDYQRWQWVPAEAPPVDGPCLMPAAMHELIGESLRLAQEGDRLYGRGDDPRGARPTRQEVPAADIVPDRDLLDGRDVLAACGGPPRGLLSSQGAPVGEASGRCAPADVLDGRDRGEELRVCEKKPVVFNIVRTTHLSAEGRIIARI